MNVLTEDNIILVLNNACNGKKDSIMCNMKNYIRYLMNLTNDAFSKCSLPFIAFGLRLVLELIVLCVYIDLHNVYGRLPLQKKLNISQGFNFSTILSRSTFFRRLFIEVLGPQEGREVMHYMRSVYGMLSQFLHTPASYCLTSLPLINPCNCIDELKELELLARKVNQIVGKLIYVWLNTKQGFKQT